MENTHTFRDSMYLSMQFFVLTLFVFFIFFFFTPSAYAASLTISGTLYSDEGVTAVSASKTIKVAVGTTTTSIHTTTTSSGVWTVTIPTGHTIVPSTPILAFVDGDASTFATTFTKASSSVNNITGLHLYQNRAIVRHEGTSGTSTTISNMSFYDSDNDTDIPYIADAYYSTLTVRKNTQLYVWSGKTFAPSGALTINGNASSTSFLDGSLHLASSATFTQGGTTTIAGNFTASSSSTFTPSTHGLSFLATTTGKVINIPFTTPLGDVTFNGRLGGWTFASNATTSNLNIQYGTVTAPTNLRIYGNFSQYGAFVHNSGIIYISTSTVNKFSGNFATTSPLYSVVMGGAATKSFVNKYAVATDTTETMISSLVVDRVNGVLYAGSGNSGIIYRCLLTSNCDDVGDFVAVFDSTETAITALAISGTYLYAGSSGEGIIFSCLLSTGCNYSAAFNTAYDTTDTTIESLVVDSVNNTLYVGATPSGSIYRCNSILLIYCDDFSDYTLAYTLTSGTQVSSLAIDTANSVLYAGTGEYGVGPADIIRCPLSSFCDDSTDFTPVGFSGPDNILSLVVDTTNGILYMGTDAWGVYRCVLSSGCDVNGDYTSVFTDAGRVYALAINTSKGELYAGNDSGIFYYCLTATGCDTSTEFITAYDTDETSIRSLAYDQTNDALYGGSEKSGFVYRCYSGSGCYENAQTFHVTNLTVNSNSTFIVPDRVVISGNFTNDGTTTSTSTNTFVFNGGSAQALAGKLTGSSTLPNVTMSGAGTKTFSVNATTSGDFTIDAGATVVAPSGGLSIGGNFTQSGTYTHNGGTLYLSGMGTVATGTLSGTSALGNVIMRADTANSKFSKVMDSTDSFIASFAVDTTNQVLYLGSAATYGIIYRCLLSTNCDESSDFATANDTVATRIYSMVIDQTNGVLYAGTGASGYVYRCLLSSGCDVAGDYSWIDITTETDIYALAIDTTNGVLYAGTNSGGIIYRCVLSSGCDIAGEYAVAYDTTETSILDITIDQTNGVLYAGTVLSGILYRCVLSSGCDIAGEYSPAYDTTESRVYSPTIDTVNGVLYIGTYPNGYVYKCVLSTSCDASVDFTLVVDTPASYTSALLVDTNNNVLYVGTGPTTSVIYQCFTGTGCSQGSYFSMATTTSDTRVYEFIVDPVSGALFAGMGASGIVYRRGNGVTLGSSASTTNLTIDAGKKITVSTRFSSSGNYTNNGTFIAGTGTTTLNGTSQQTISGIATGTSSFYNLELTNSSASTTFNVPFTVSKNFRAVIPNTKIELKAGATTTLGTTTITGTSGNEVKLRSTTSGTKAGLSVAGPYSLSFIDVKDSSATSSALLTATSYIDSGNNNGWDFTLVGGNATLSGGSNQTFALNYPTTSISTLTITDNASPSITSANDIRIKISTTTVRMLWDTTDTTATFGGTASAKVSNPVSYEGGGSILVIPVGTNFGAGDTLTVSGLSLSQFTATNTATSALAIRTAGAGTTTVASDDKTVIITGSLTLANHSQSQVADSFQESSLTNAILYRYLLTPFGEDMVASTTVFTLTGVNGVNQGDLSNLTLWKDMNNDGAYDASDIQVGGAGAISVIGQTGTITFSTPYSATTTRSYMLRGDVAEIRPGDMLTISLSSSNVTAGGQQTYGTVLLVGSVAGIQHDRGGLGGGSTGAIGGDAPPGQGIRTGGEEGAGSGEVDTNTNGATLGDEPNFNAPSSQGSPQSGWTTGGNAYSSDGSYATAASGGLRHSYGGLNQNVPGNNTITGIEVLLEAAGSTAAGTIDVKLSWNGGSSLTSAQNSGTLTATDAVYTFGGASNLWGYSWTPAEISNLQIEVIGNPSGNTVKIDAIRLRVYHQATGGGDGGGGGEVSIPSKQHFASLNGNDGHRMSIMFPEGLVAGITTDTDLRLILKDLDTYIRRYLVPQK